MQHTSPKLALWTSVMAVMLLVWINKFMLDFSCLGGMEFRVCGFWCLNVTSTLTTTLEWLQKKWGEFLKRRTQWSLSFSSGLLSWIYAVSFLKWPDMTACCCGRSAEFSSGSLMLRKAASCLCSHSRSMPVDMATSCVPGCISMAMEVDMALMFHCSSSWCRQVQMTVWLPWHKLMLEWMFLDFRCHYCVLTLLVGCQERHLACRICYCISSQEVSLWRLIYGNCRALVQLIKSQECMAPCRLQGCKNKAGLFYFLAGGHKSMQNQNVDCFVS